MSYVFRIWFFNWNISCHKRPLRISLRNNQGLADNITLNCMIVISMEQSHLLLPRMMRAVLWSLRLRQCKLLCCSFLIWYCRCYCWGNPWWLLRKFFLWRRFFTAKRGHNIGTDSRVYLLLVSSKLLHQLLLIKFLRRDKNYLWYVFKIKLLIQIISDSCISEHWIVLQHIILFVLYLIIWLQNYSAWRWSSLTFCGWYLW